MKAMILAAGRGNRLRPLTDTIPKPLVPIGDHTLIEHHLLALARAGIKEVMINLHYKGDVLEKHLGDGSRYGVTLHYLKEEILLNTGGGIKHALALLGEEPFILISADIFTDFDFTTLMGKTDSLGHLLVVDNPVYHLEGDFGLDAEGVVVDKVPRLTYANISVLHPQLFEAFPVGNFPIIDVFRRAMEKRLLTGERYTGNWHNVGDYRELVAARESVSS